MRRLIATLLIIGALPVAAFAASGAQTLVNESGLAYTTTYTQNLQAFGNPQSAASKLSVQVTWSSANFVTSSFTDGTQSTGSITVASNNLLSVAATNQITVPSTALILGSGATSQVTISSCVPKSTVYFSGRGIVEGKDWNCGASTTLSAAALASGFNTAFGNIFTSTNVGAVVYSTMNVVGSYANGYTVTSSSAPAYTVSNFSGGLDPALRNAIIYFNGVPYQNGYFWTDASGTSAGTAASIAAMFQTFGVVTATSAAGGSVVYSTATTKGSAANAYTLTASTNKLTIASTKYTNGQDAATLTLNGKTFTAGVDFSTGATTSNTATSLAAAITAAAATVKVNAQAVAAVVRATSTVNGVSSKYLMSTNSPSYLTLSGATMTGGTNAGTTLNSSVISLPSHGFTTALPVLYGQGALLGGLTDKTTYYAVVVDANNIKLSSTSAVAQTGNGIVITSSSSQTTAHTFTLTPISWLQGPASAKWRVSNDGVNFADFSSTSNNVTVSSQTFAAVYPSSTTVQDFGNVDYGYLQYSVTGPTWGGINLKVILNAKD